MGKKTFEEIGKILLVSIISILLTTMSARRLLLDSKLDKTEYEKDQEKRGSAHKEVHLKEKEIQDLDREDAKETNRMVKFLYEQAIKENN